MTTVMALSVLFATAWQICGLHHRNPTADEAPGETPGTSGNQPADVHGAECNHYGAQRPGAAVTKLWDTWSASRLPETTCSHCM